MECGAKRRNGEPCKARAMLNGRCRIHGGKSPAGIPSPHYRDGRYSKVLPQRMRDAYTLAMDDPQLLEQREQIAVLDARLLDLLGRVDTGESGALWQALKDCRSDLLIAQRGNDVKGQTA